MPTANLYIGPEDGWVQLADSPKFIRTSGYPHSHPYYLASGSSAPSLFPAVATGTVTFSTANPAANGTVTIGSEVYTFKVAATVPFDVVIGTLFTDTAQNFADVVNSTSTLVTASNAAGTVTITTKIGGANYNYTLSKTATNVAVSGAHLTGGADVTVGILVCHHPFKVNVTMAEKLYARIVNPVPNSNRQDGKLRLDVFTIS